MAGKVLASRSPWDRRNKAMTSLWSSPASFVSVSHGTVGMVDNLEINKMVHILIVAHELL